MQVEKTEKISLSDLYLRYQMGLGMTMASNGLIALPVTKPSHQRDSRWSIKKRKKWIASIEKASKEPGQTVPGMITLYHIRDEWTRVTLDNKIIIPEKINDGIQRTIYTIQWYINLCESKKTDPWPLLKSVKITYQKLIYDNNTEAFNHFIEMNSLGTACTAKELTEALLSNELGDSWVTTWKPKLLYVSKLISKSLIYVTGKTDNDENTEKSDNYTIKVHKRLRDDMGLLYRFLSEDLSRRKYDTGRQTIRLEQLGDHKLLEKQLCVLFLAQGSVKIDERIKKFEELLKSGQAFLFQIWNECGMGIGRSPCCTFVRWWLSFYIYFKNHNCKPDQLRTFTKALIMKCSGKTTIPYGVNNHVNLSTGNLSQLGVLCQALGLPDDFITKPTRPPVTNHNRAGFHESHIVPHSVNGNNVTLPENSIENLSRGANTMNDETVKTLQQLNPTNTQNEFEFI